MPNRRDSWNSTCAEYSEGLYSSRGGAKELAAACLLLREAEWANDIYPFVSHGQLGLSTASDYVLARQRRAVWLAAETEGRLTATFQETLGSKPERTELIASVSEVALRAVVEWLRGEAGA